MCIRDSLRGGSLVAPPPRGRSRARLPRQRACHRHAASRGARHFPGSCVPPGLRRRSSQSVALCHSGQRTSHGPCPIDWPTPAAHVRRRRPPLPPKRRGPVNEHGIRSARPSRPTERRATHRFVTAVVSLSFVVLAGCDKPSEGGAAPKPSASVPTPAPQASASAAPSTTASAPKAPHDPPTQVAAQHVLVPYKGAEKCPKGVTRSKAEAKKRAEEVSKKAKEKLSLIHI